MTNYIYQKKGDWNMEYIEQMNNLVASIEVKEYEGQPVVSSREIADNFEKNHKEVLRSIDNRSI